MISLDKVYLKKRMERFFWYK